jgi:nucleoside-diphosphate-sugar epimerase
MEHIYITGGTGCVGSYIVDELKNRTDLTLHLLVRDPKRFRLDLSKYPNIKLHKGNLEQIEEHADLLKTMDYVIHVATDWSDSSYARKLNEEKTHELFELANEGCLKKVVYFSTASILGPGNKTIEAAGKYGQGYVRSKYRAYHSLQNSPVRSKIITVFPTLVFGGDDNHPFSHINKGMHSNLSYLKLLRFLYVDGAFHFLHSRDIARVAIYTLLNDVDKDEYVLGNASVNAKQAIEALCSVFNVPLYFRVKITQKFIFTLAKWFKIKLGPWEKHCIMNPHMVYDVVNPSTFGQETAFPTLKSVLQNIKDVGPRKKK